MATASQLLSGAVPVFLQSESSWVLYCPPFWFLGIYQRLLEGPSALPIYGRLAQTGCAALAITAAVAIVAYPVAYVRRVRRLVLGSGTHDTPGKLRDMLAGSTVFGAVSQGILLGMSVLMITPALMPFLSLVV